MVDYFKVFCFNDNNNNIISMCPSNHCECLPYVDLNYLKENDKPKVKTISQIEKFNRRYKNIKRN